MCSSKILENKLFCRTTRKGIFPVSKNKMCYMSLFLSVTMFYWHSSSSALLSREHSSKKEYLLLK